MPFVVSDGARIHYEIDGDGPALVLHHGFTHSLQSWYDMGYVAALKRRHRLILLDARGHGASDKPHDPHVYTLAQQAADVVAVLDALDVEQADYFGYSMGGRVGFALARIAAQRIRSMVIVAASPYRPRGGGLTEWIRYLERGMEAFVCWGETQGEVPAAIRETMLANDADALKALWTARMDTPAMEAVLARMVWPCLLMAGTRDPVRASTEAAAAAMPNARFVSLSELNHGESFYRSDAVLAHLERFPVQSAPAQ